MSIKAAATFVLLSVPFFLLTVWALVDISIKDFKTLKEKVIWYLIALIPFIGWLIYLILGFRRGIKPDRSPG
ncbi:MAG: PLDc N-terminal domain-containing protein [Desulfosalsimonas sp.]